MNSPSALDAFSTLQGLAPRGLLRRWPADRSLVMLHSGRVHPKWARWSILAAPRAWYVFNGQSRWIGDPSKSLKDVAFTHDPMHDLDAIIALTSARYLGPENRPLPFRGGWIGYFSYDLGRMIEPKAQVSSRINHEHEWPLIQLAWCPDALVFDHLAQQWHQIGDVAQLGENLQDAALLNDQCFTLGELQPQIQPQRYMSMVQRAIDYIAAGDIFQANIAQQFNADFSGNTRALCDAVFERDKPWYGAYLECGEKNHQTVISLSPELFLQVEADSRHVITRPIKGTRPATSTQRELRDSEKDTAELNMIIDLMRNDLGRVCEIGSIKVANAREIESHPTVHHGVGEVHGTLCRNISLANLLRAAFPGGSVTGAPKIRAMQIIDELEPKSRGPYCGAIGFISNHGNITLNIAIRTMLLHHNALAPDRTNSLNQATLYYSAGAGIVADSKSESEFQETIDKTAPIRALIATGSTQLLHKDS
jgi:para-aminobenzoate synthetase component I